MKNLNELRDVIHLNAVLHGFYDEEPNISERLMLIVTEIAEACEAMRSNHFSPPTDQPEFDWESNFKELVKDSFEDELADALIRILDLCGYMQIDIEKHVQMKMHYNESRPYKHGKKF